MGMFDKNMNIQQTPGSNKGINIGDFHEKLGFCAMEGVTPF